jgi:hypothetical protein
MQDEAAPSRRAPGGKGGVSPLRYFWIWTKASFTQSGIFSRYLS